DGPPARSPGQGTAPLRLATGGDGGTARQSGLRRPPRPRPPDRRRRPRSRDPEPPLGRHRPRCRRRPLGTTGRRRDATGACEPGRRGATVGSAGPAGERAPVWRSGTMGRSMTRGGRATAMAAAALVGMALGTLIPGGSSRVGAEGSPPAPEYLNADPQSGAPFSDAVRAGSMLYMAGNLGLDKDGKLVPGGITGEA